MVRASLQFPFSFLLSHFGVPIRHPLEKKYLVKTAPFHNIMPPPLFESMQIMYSIESESPKRKRSFSSSDSSTDGINESYKRSRLVVASDYDTTTQPIDVDYDLTKDFTDDEDGRTQTMSVFNWSESDDEADEDPRITLENRRREYFESATLMEPRPGESGYETPPHTPVREAVSWREYFEPASQRKSSAGGRSSRAFPSTPTTVADMFYDSGVCSTPARAENDKSRPSARLAAPDALQSPVCSTIHQVKDPTEAFTKSRCRNGRFSWNTTHRLTLVLLRTEFGGSWHETTTRFNTIFEQDITDQGFPSGSLNMKAVTSTYYGHTYGLDNWREANTLLEQGGSKIEQLRVSIRQTLNSSNSRDTPRPIPWPTPPSMPSTLLASLETTLRKTRRTLKTHKTPSKRGARQAMSPEQAHPPLPVLLFRCYHSENQGINSPDGFVAGRFTHRTTPIPPPPHCSDPQMLAETHAHLDRQHTHTPFISTTEAFVNVIVRALRERNKGHTCRLSIINIILLPRLSIFHAKPYHASLASHGPAFSGINVWYKPTTEYLIWGQIPARAILNDISLADLETFVNGHDVLRPVLRLDILGDIAPWADSVVKRLKARPVYLTPTIIPTLADLTAYLLANEKTKTEPPAPAALVARLLSEVVRGWDVQVDRRKADTWRTYATLFALGLVAREKVDVGAFSERFMRLCEGFLSGVRVGLGERG